jgi:Flp pilus assembly protein TadG
MRRIMLYMGDLVRRFAKNAKAVAAVEFALILPLLLTLYVGSVELSSAITVDKRVASVSGALGDLVARADGTISESTVDDYFYAASTTMAPYSNSAVKQVVSCIYVDSDGNSTVAWSRSYNGATAHADGSAYHLPSDLKNLALDGYVIVAEAQLNYAPLFGYVFETSFSLYHEYYFLPRFGEEITITAS